MILYYSSLFDTSILKMDIEDGYCREGIRRWILHWLLRCDGVSFRNGCRREAHRFGDFGG